MYHATVFGPCSEVNTKCGRDVSSSSFSTRCSKALNLFLETHMVIPPFLRRLRLMMGEAFAIIGKQIFDSQSRKELVANIQSLRHRKFTVPVDFASSGFVGTSNQFLYIQCGYAKPAHFCTKVSHEYSSFRLLNCVYTLDYTLYCVKNQPFSEKKFRN